MLKHTEKKPRLTTGLRLKALAGAFLLSGLLLSGADPARAEAPQTFPSPESAVKALLQAAKAHNQEALLKIFGTDAKDLVNSGDETADKAERAAFVKAYNTKHALIAYGDIVHDAESVGEKAENEAGKSKAAPPPQLRILQIGEKNWPFPIPLVSDASGKEWSFDTKSGLEEVLDRRIGRNELSALEVCRAYVDAQYEYYKLNPDKSVIPHFAAKIVSSPGKRDGLYWESKAGEPASPLGELMADAAAEGYATPQQGGGKPYHGYRYRILTEQGPAAPHGAYSYMGGDFMFGGFALLAFPFNYGVTGVMSFIVNQDGVVYEKNLGEDTAALAEKITSFNPDSSWNKIDDNDK